MLAHATVPWNPPSPAHGSRHSHGHVCFAAPAPWWSRTIGDLPKPRASTRCDQCAGRRRTHRSRRLSMRTPLARMLPRVMGNRRWAWRVERDRGGVCGGPSLANPRWLYELFERDTPIRMSPFRRLEWVHRCLDRLTVPGNDPTMTARVDCAGSSRQFISRRECIGHAENMAQI